MRPHGKRMFYKEKLRLSQLNDSIEYMGAMMHNSPPVVQAILKKNIDQAKEKAKTILNQMVQDGYTGESNG
jgi:spore coat protein CotF